MATTTTHGNNSTHNKRRVLAKGFLLALVVALFGGVHLIILYRDVASSSFPSSSSSFSSFIIAGKKGGSFGKEEHKNRFYSSSLSSSSSRRRSDPFFEEFEFDEEEEEEEYWKSDDDIDDIDDVKVDENDDDDDDAKENRRLNNNNDDNKDKVAKETTFSAYKKRMGRFRDAIEALEYEEEDGEDERKKTKGRRKTETSAAADEPPPLDELETPLNPRKCSRSIAMKPSRRLARRFDEEANERCGKRWLHEDFPPIAVVAAIHARSLMKIKSRSNEAMTEFTENLRMAFGDERDKKSELHSDGELILVVYGVNEETAPVLQDVEKLFFRENDFFLAIVDGDERALNEISDYDDAIARGMKFTRAKFAIVADLNAIVPSAEWTKMALVKVFRTEPMVTAVLFGGNENVSGFEGVKRPAMVVRTWEAKFALTEDGSSGCTNTEKSLVSIMAEKGMEFKRLPRKLKRITSQHQQTRRERQHEEDSSGSITSDDSTGDSISSTSKNRKLLLLDVAGSTSKQIIAGGGREEEEEEEEMDIINGKWETNANRGGVDGAFDLGCKSPSKRIEKSVFCPSSVSSRNTKDNKKQKRRVQATFIMQYFNRAKTLGEIFDALVKSVKQSSISSSASFTMEVLANIDSGYKKSDNWIKHALEFKKQTGNQDSPFVLAFSNDIHELRAYNRLAHVATAEFLVFAQDDDKPDVEDPSSLSWLLDGLSLMRRHKDLALLGAYRGRYDDGSRMKKSSNQNDGSKFGGNFESDRETRPIAYVDRELGVPFLWMYKVNMGPLMFRKSIFLSSGGFHDQFSCAGEMAQGFDFEISVRMWSEGFKVGLYDPKWKHRIDKDLTQIVNQNRHRDVQKKELTDAKDAATRRNNENIYTLFASNKNFHHEKGTKLAKKALKEDLAKKTLLCALPKTHELCHASFLDTPRDTITCMSADRKCFQRKYIEKHNVAGANDEDTRQSLPKDENGDIDVSKIRFTKGEKVRFKYEWLEHDGAQRVWNEALMETQKVALKTASRLRKRNRSNGVEDEEDDESLNLSVENAIKQWLHENTPAINEKVEKVRLQLAKEAEPELKRAEELAAKGLIYGTGGAVSEEERARRTKEAKFVDKKTRERVVELAGIKAFEEGKEERAAWER